MLIGEKYLSKLREFYDSRFVKILGQHGKSTLLKQAMEEIKARRINEDHIVYINFKNLAFNRL